MEQDTLISTLIEKKEEKRFFLDFPVQNHCKGTCLPVFPAYFFFKPVFSGFSSPFGQPVMLKN